MNTIIITNPEASFYIENIKDLMENSLKEEYELLPQTINFHFDPALIIAAPEAIYAIILIMKYGYDTIKSQLKKKALNNVTNINLIQIDDAQQTYKIETSANNVCIKINHKDNYTELSVKELNGKEKHM